MNERRNISSKGMKKKKVITVSALLLLCLLTSFPHIENTQIVKEMPVGPPYSQKISHLLVEQMVLTDDDAFLNVIAVTTCNINKHVIYDLESRVGKLDVKRVFTVYPSFEIRVTPIQIEALAAESMIQALEWGDEQGELCMNDAQYYSNTDDLRLPGGYNLDGSGVTVAVVDSGIWTGHDDLDDGQLIVFRDIVGNGTHDDFSEAPDGIDNYGHGTSMAGIIAGSGDGDPYLIGVASGASLVGVRIANDSSSVNYTDAVAALNWVGVNADEYEIDIVSCSFGFPKNTLYYGDAANCDVLAKMADILVTDYGLIFVASAGNYGPPITVKEPASGKYTICVGAACDPSAGGWCFKDDGPTQSSNVGPINYMDDNLTANPDWYKPDVLAPGKNIMCPTIGDSDSYDEISGTSPATAFVSGMIALYLEYDGDLAEDNDNDGNPDVKQLLWASAIHVPGDNELGIDGYYGAGRVDGLAGLDFYTRDISSSKGDAVSFTSTYTRNNEPMSRLDDIPDFEDFEDWYKYPATSDFDITISVSCDPDLMVEVILYRGTTLEEYANSSERGENCYIEHTGSTGADYYILVRLIGDYGDMGFPGDYYDIVIDITSF